MAGASVGELVIQLRTAGINVTEKQLRKLGKSSEKAGMSIQGMIASVGGIYALGRAFSSVVSTGQEFTSSLSNLSAILGQSKDQMGKLSDTARQLGASTKFTAGEVVQLQTEFAKLGYTEEQIVAAQEATLALASAVNVELSVAAEVAGQTINAFGLQAEDTQRVVDVMASSFSKSALDMDKFTNSMTYVSVVAKQSGLSVEATTGVLGKLADVGISGSIAGTALRRILLEMGNESSKLSKKVGFAVQSNEDLFKALKMLNAEGLSTAEMEDLVGKRAVSAFGSMLQMSEGSEELAEALANAGGTAQDMADKQLDNLEGDLYKLNSALDGVYLKMYDDLEPVLRDVTQAFTNWIANIDEEDIRAYSTAIGVAAGITGIYTMATLSAAAANRVLNIAIAGSAIFIFVTLLAEAIKYMGWFDDTLDTSITTQTKSNVATKEAAFVHKESEHAKRGEAAATVKLINAEKDLADSRKIAEKSYSTDAIDLEINTLNEKKRLLQEEFDFRKGITTDFKNIIDKDGNDRLDNEEAIQKRIRKFLKQTGLEGKMTIEQARGHGSFLNYFGGTADIKKIDGRVEAKKFRKTIYKEFSVMQDDIADLNMKTFNSALKEYGTYLDKKIEVATGKEKQEWLAKKTLWEQAGGENQKINKAYLDQILADFDGWNTASSAITKNSVVFSDKALVFDEESLKHNMAVLDAEIVILQLRAEALKDGTSVNEELTKTLKNKNIEQAISNAEVAEGLALDVALANGVEELTLSQITMAAALLQRGYSEEYVNEKLKESMGVTTDYVLAIEELRAANERESKASVENALISMAAKDEAFKFTEDTVNKIKSLVDSGMTLDDAIFDVTGEGVNQQYLDERQATIDAMLEIIAVANETELETQRRHEEAKLELEWEKMQESLEFKALSDEQRKALQDIHNKKMNDIEKKQQAAEDIALANKIKGYADAAGALASIWQATGKNADLVAGIQVAQAIADTYAAATSAFHKHGGWPGGVLPMSMSIMQGLAQVAQIRKAREDIKAQASKSVTAEYGASFITQGETTLTVGDNPGGREMVNVTPISSPNMFGDTETGGQQNISINIEGGVVSSEFVEGELAEKISDAVRRGVDFGMS